MSEEKREFSGRSVDEAVATGLQTLGLRSNQVQVEVINKGSRGLFGIGSEPALIRITRLTPVQPEPVIAPQSIAPQSIAGIETITTSPVATSNPLVEKSAVEKSAVEKSAQDDEIAEIAPFSSEDSSPNSVTTAAASVDPAGSDESATVESEAAIEAATESAAVAMLAKMVTLLGFTVKVEPVWKDGDDEHDKRVLWLEIHGRNLSTLIGRRGETLENIQYLLRMMVNQRLHRWNDIVVDIEQYRLRRAEQIAQLAARLAEQALSAGRAMSLEPMPPNERRIVHMALRDHPHVYTQSSGDGERRKVFIVPKN